jgi:4-hydroxy-tetrahydrodipicolinate synthase
MLSERDLTGIIVPVITPFLPNDRLDLDSYESYLSPLIEHPIQGLVINGTTGECPTVEWDEVERLVASTREVMRRKQRQIPLILGSGTNSTTSTLKRTELAGQLGADAALVVVPYYSRPSQAGIIEHFRKVAEVGIPIIVYEVPSRTGVRLTADTTRTLLEMNGVIGLKDSSGDLALLFELMRHDTKPVLCGDDPLFHEMMCLGASGGLLASANVHTSSFIDVFEHHRSGDPLAAEVVFGRLIPLIRLLFRESNPAPLKRLLARQGTIASDHLRLPLSPITPALQLELERTFLQFFN